MDTILLQLPNINGNSMITNYTNAIMLENIQLGVSIPLNPDVANTERTLGRPRFSQVQLSKVIDQSTPALYSACASGTKLGNATISVGRNEGGNFMLHMQYVLTDAMIGSINTAASGEGGYLTESVTLGFSQITMTYTQQNTDSTQKGTASFGWNLATNAAVSSS